MKTTTFPNRKVSCRNGSVQDRRRKALPFYENRSRIGTATKDDQNVIAFESHCFTDEKPVDMYGSAVGTVAAIVCRICPVEGIGIMAYL